MDIRPSDHPTPEILQAYGLGKLDDASAGAVNKHLEACTDCRRQVAEMAPDSFLARLRDVQDVPETSTSPGATDIPLAQAGDTQPQTTVADDATVDRSAPPYMSSEGHVEAPSPVQSGASGPALQPGTFIGYFGDYELQKVLGEGGMGIVYKARQLSLNRPVALKMIRAARFASPDEVRRFQNEAESVARLDHPHIVPIFEVGRFEDQHYFSMKLVGGESLDKRLKDYVSDPRRAARLVVIAAGAVHHAHQRGTLHRDLKPTNILLDSDGSPHVTDFGLAKRIEGDSELTQSGALLGTPAYMAPEQASGKRGGVTTATDVYGLGAILYAVLTGRAPFGGSTVPEALEQVRERPPDSPRKLNPRVPRDLEVICQKCLEKDPRRRYASADALAEDLDHWLSGKPIAARPVRSAARIWMFCRRNPILASASGLVSAALVAVAVLSLLYASQQSRHANEQAEATANIVGLNKDLKKERQDLQTSLADSNRRLAMLNFERAQRAFDGGQINRGLLWLVETWRYALEAEDRALQHLARVNLSLWRYCCSELKGVLSHPSEVRCVTFSPDGRTILTGSGDGTARLWDAATAKPIGQLMMHRTRVCSVAFSPDGKTVLTGSLDKTARLWAAATGLPVGTPLEHQGTVTSVAFSPDGKTVLTGCWDGTARLWDAATAKPIGQPLGHSQPVTSVAFSLDGKAVLTSSVFTAHLWEAVTAQHTGQPMPHIDGPVPGAPLFSPDGKTILTNAPQLWDVATAQPIGKRLKSAGTVRSMAFSPDGKTILTGSEDKSARLWDAATSQTIGQPMEHQGSVSSVAFSPDGKSVLTGSTDNKARLWDAATGLSIGHAFDHQAAVTAVKYSPDGKTILTVSGDNTARLWDAATAQPIGHPLEDRDRVTFTAPSPDGSAILIGSFPPFTVRLWDATSVRPIGQKIINQEYISSLAFSPDGKTLLTASRNTARQWDAMTSRPIGQPMWHQGRVTAVNYSPDGKTILTGSEDSTARLWDAPTGQPVSDPLVHEGAVRYVRFGPDGKTILTGSEDNTARLWDVATAQPIGQPMVHQAALTYVAYNPGGKALLTMSGDTTRLWDAATTQRIGKPMKHRGVVGSLAFSPDGKTILSGSTDNAARLWNAATGEPIGQPLQHGAAVECVWYSPDGMTLISGSKDGIARLWDAGTALPIGHPFQHQAAVERSWDAGTAVPILQSSRRQVAVKWVTCSPDGKNILTGTDGGTARLWHLPAAVDDDLQRILVWVETITGLRVDDQGAIHPLNSVAWQEQCERLRQLGGPPKSDPRWLFDPILYGPDPTARARAWMNRKRWTEAEAAFDEAVRARPLSGAIRRERGTFHDAGQRTDKADEDFARAYALGDIPFVRMRFLTRGPFLHGSIGRYISDMVIDHARAPFPDDATGLSTELLLSRAEQLVKRRLWGQARATLVQTGDLPRGIPEDSMLLEERGDLFALMGYWNRAAAGYHEVIQRWPEGHPIRHRQILSLLADGDHVGLRSAVSGLLDRFRNTTDPEVASDVAWSCVSVPGGVADQDGLVRLAELALRSYASAQAHLIPNTLGAALYRAGRFEESIRRLEEGIQGNSGRQEPADWAYLAMAHFQVGHRDVARRWLDHFKNYQPSDQEDVHSRGFWDELEIRILRTEAEAVILYDPIFPPDPFVH